MKLHTKEFLYKDSQFNCVFGVFGFTLIEVMGVLAIVAILAAAMIPAIMASLKRSERQNEEANLDAIVIGLKDYIIRERSIPDESSWIQIAADELNISTDRVEFNEGGWIRVFMPDPLLRIGITNTSILPYTQTIQGSIQPVTPRALLISCLTRNLPTLSTNDFGSIWDAAPGDIPGSWSTDWEKYAKDLKLKRIDFRDLFHRLVLNNIDSQLDAQFSIDDLSAIILPSTNFVERWYLKNTSVGLRFTDGTLQIQEVMVNDRSYVFQNGSWSRKFSQGTDGTGSFGQLVDAFLSAPLSPDRVFGAEQQAVVNEMYWYMWSYALWANDGFPKGGSNSDQQVPAYRAVNDSQDRLEDFADNLIQ